MSPPPPPSRRWVSRDAFWAPGAYSLLRRVNLVLAVLAVLAAIVSVIVLRSWLLGLLFLLMAAVSAWQRP